MSKTEHSQQPQTLVLLDVHAIIHRAYHALPDFASSGGEPTGALYGLCTMLLKIVSELSPEYIVACYDLPEKTHRHEAYKEYKATRKKIDDALIVQLERSKDIFSALSIPMYSHAGFEADDMLGTIAEQVKHRADIAVVIASGDMDTLQLVDGEKVRVYTLRKGIKDTVIYDERAVVERFGFPPALLPDFKGLRGDPSDNIIGIAGIGEKTATTLIQTFGSLEDMYRALAQSSADEAFVKAGIKPRIIELLRAGQEEALFSKTLATIRRDAPIQFSVPDTIWKESVRIETVEELFSKLEFRSLVPRVREALGKPSSEHASVSTVSGPSTLSARDERALSIALWIIDSNITSPTLEDVLRFAHTDSPERAREFLMSELEKRNLMRVFKEIEEPLMDVVDAMQKRGITVDTGYLKTLALQYHKELSALEEKIWEAADEKFNINSPKQMGAILFDKLGLTAKGLKKTAGGVKSTRESELEKMRDLHPIIDHILRYRMLQKLLSTYIDNIPTMLGEDGRLHATFLQHGTTTGRMSSNNPNIQNIPIKTDEGRRIRNAFVATKGFKLVAFDYSQIELRVAAFLSGDEKLIEIFRSGGDIHAGVASAVFKVPPEKVDHEMRRRAKVINFGILYGMGVNALRGNLGTSRDEAQQFLDEYFSTFSGLATYLESVKASAKKLGYTETLFGRRRYFPNIRSKLPYIQAQNERMAMNAPMQGTAADIIKIAMSRICAHIHSRNLTEKVYLLMQVHDELVFEIAEDAVGAVVPELKNLMEGVLTPEQSRGVPMLVKGKIGDNWGETEEV